MLLQLHSALLFSHTHLSIKKVGRNKKRPKFDTGGKEPASHASRHLSRARRQSERQTDSRTGERERSMHAVATWREKQYKARRRRRWRMEEEEDVEEI